MESARKVINQFLKGKYSGNELKSELFKAGEAAQQDGWTYMDASFQLGGVARDQGLAPEEVEQILRRAFSSEKRAAEREEDKPKDIPVEAPAAPVQPTIISPMPAGMFSMEQMLAMGLDTQSLTLLQNHKIDPEALAIPSPSHDWRKDLAKLLEAVFEPDETIEFKISDTPKCTAEKVSNIVGQDAAITKIMKSLDSPEGALICVNATAGGEDATDESFRYRYVVVDSPKMLLAKQLAYYKALNLPCAAIVNTLGANSAQAWVRIGASNLDEYYERVDFLFKTLEDQGFKVDPINRNPNMMARMPGVLRGGKQQYLIGLEQGAKNFKEWQEWVEYSLDGKPLIELASDTEEAPKKDQTIVENMLRAGEFFLFTAPPKSGKSLALMDLGLSICYGEDWFGNSTSSSDVLFINFELTKSVFLNRRVVVIDPISAVLHNPKSTRLNGAPHQILMQMVDTIIALTGCAVVSSCNLDEYPYLEARADSLIKLSPVEGSLNLYQINGTFREFPKMLARECSWIYPRFLV